jgi:hypothetical protein
MTHLLFYSIGQRCTRLRTLIGKAVCSRRGESRPGLRHGFRMAISATSDVRPIYVVVREALILEGTFPPRD